MGDKGYTNYCWSCDLKPGFPLRTLISGSIATNNYCITASELGQTLQGQGRQTDVCHRLVSHPLSADWWRKPQRTERLV